MRKFTKKRQLIAYGCAGLGVNMLNLIMGSYLCSALLVGGFEAHMESWTFLGKDLVVPALWAGLILAAKVIDGLIDLPMSHFTDQLQTRWGRRRPAIVMGYVPMIAAYVLFLFPVQPTAGILNTIWFAGLLFVFYGCYTLTMLTYYATFAEVTETQEDLVLLSNIKSVCDVVYFCLGFALVPAFVSMGVNIRIVALIFLPLSLTMLIPLFMLKEDKQPERSAKERTTFVQSFVFAMKDKPFVLWMCILFVMNIGLQLFLSGINEYFSTMGLNMTFIMASCFVPVPFTIMLYNWVVKKRGLGFAYRYILAVFSLGMGLMGVCRAVPEGLLFPFAIGCSLIVSFAIGAFFSVTYTVPSQRAALRQGERKAASSMYFAIQGLFEGASAGLASGVVLVYLKQNGYVRYLTVIVAAVCMTALLLSFLLPKAITQIGRERIESVKA